MRALVLVHRHELAKQAARRFTEFEVPYGYVMPGEPAKPYAPVQIAMVQTLARRKQKPRAHLVIPDEAHLSTAATWSATLDHYPDARIVGFTATPWRLGGKPLGGQYDELIVIATPRELRELGFLCDYQGFSYLTPDLSKVKISKGEFNEKQSAEAMKAPQIVANILEQWLAHASHLSTIAFAVNVEHSKALTAEFRAAGVSTEHLDGNTPKKQREAILARVESGQTRVLVNVGVAVEGIDIPRLKCVIDACPTKSVSRALQKWGRVRRPWNGVVARIHDHAFNIRTHGLPDADREYSLSVVAKSEAPPSLKTCEKCRAVYDGPRCTSCLHENVAKRPAGELVTVDDAEQFEFSSGQETAVVATPLPPVEVRWDRPGRVIEGTYTGSTLEKASWGNQLLYNVTGTKRAYRLPGTAHLHDLMSKVISGSRVRVTFEREREFAGGRSKKYFKVEVDDGT